MGVPVCITVGRELKSDFLLGLVVGKIVGNSEFSPLVGLCLTSLLSSAAFVGSEVGSLVFSHVGDQVTVGYQV
jgi:hypothetical protein